MFKKNKIILALDPGNMNKALEIVKDIDKSVIFKLGMEFFYSFGFEGVEKLKSINPNMKIFLDLKFHDIPNTVCKSIIPLIKRVRPFMITLHTTGGLNMMCEVVKSVKEFPKSKRPLLLGVTVLTSLNSKALRELGWPENVNQNVIKYALLAKKAGLNGIVCSALEIELVRKACGKNFTIVTPGIRFNKNKNEDQARVVTPEEAFKKGTDYIVIGRPVMNASNPKKELSRITGKIQCA